MHEIYRNRSNFSPPTSFNLGFGENNIQRHDDNNNISNKKAGLDEEGLNNYEFNLDFEQGDKFMNDTLSEIVQLEEYVPLVDDEMAFSTGDFSMLEDDTPAPMENMTNFVAEFATTTLIFPTTPAQLTMPTRSAIESLIPSRQLFPLNLLLRVHLLLPLHQVFLINLLLPMHLQIEWRMDTAKGGGRKMNRLQQI
jgi:hypothetical protein